MRRTICLLGILQRLSSLCVHNGLSYVPPIKIACDVLPIPRPFVTHMQFLAARSLWTSFMEAMYSIPLAIWKHISVSSVCSNPFTRLWVRRDSRGEYGRGLGLGECCKWHVHIVCVRVYMSIKIVYVCNCTVHGIPDFLWGYKYSRTMRWRTKA